MFKSALIDKLNLTMAQGSPSGGGVRVCGGGGGAPFPMLPIHSSSYQTNVPSAIATNLAMPVGYNTEFVNSTSIPYHLQIFTPALTNIY